MDNAEKIMRAMGEVIESMKTNLDYKTRMKQEVVLMYNERIEKYPGLRGRDNIKASKVSPEYSGSIMVERPPTLNLLRRIYYGR